MPDRYRALVVLAAGTGLRQGEAFGLEVEAVDWLRRTLDVRQQLVLMPGGAPYVAPLKTPASYRTVPLPAVVVDALTAHLAAFPAGGSRSNWNLIGIGVGALVREGALMLKVVHDVEASNEPAGGSLLDEIVRDGARRMLAAALQAEVAAYVEQFKDELDEHGRRLVVRNGFHAEREVTTAAGAIPVRAPRVNDKRVDEATGERKRFGSAILPAWAGSPRGSRRCCRRCTCTACRPRTSPRR